MTCKSRLYVNKDFDIPLTITDASFTAAEISDMTVTFTMASNPATTASFIKSSGDITISGSTITLLIRVGDITTAGDYKIKIDMTDTGGGDRGITPCPAQLTFYDQ